MFLWLNSVKVKTIAVEQKSIKVNRCKKDKEKSEI